MTRQCIAQAHPPALVQRSPENLTFSSIGLPAVGTNTSWGMHRTAFAQFQQVDLWPPFIEFTQLASHTTIGGWGAGSWAIFFLKVILQSSLRAATVLRTYLLLMDDTQSHGLTSFFISENRTARVFGHLTHLLAHCFVEVLLLEKDAWYMVNRQRQATNGYAPPPPIPPYCSKKT